MSNLKAASELVGKATPDWLLQWGGFASDVTFPDLPEAVVSRAKLVLLDCIGVIAAGMQEPELKALVASSRGPSPDAPAGAAVIGAGCRLDPGSAAFLNGTAGTFLELDEGNQFARGHPAIHVVPAALAEAGRRNAAGPSLLVALAVGYEVAARIGIAAKLNVTMHPHGVWGTVGAAVASGRIRGMDASRMIQVINVSSSLGLSTSRKTMLEGATVRNTYAGFSSQLGLMAGELVSCGFTGETDGIATIYDTVVASGFRPGEMVAELGTRWEIARNYFKQHAACRYTHGALDALHDIMAQAGTIDIAEIDAILVDTYSWAAQLDWAEPKNMLAAKFSIPFALATTLVNGAATVAAFRRPALEDPAIAEIARRVEVRESPAFTAQLPSLRPARVTLVLGDGRRFTAAVETNRGDMEAPYTREEVTAKFFALTEPVWGASRAEQVCDAVDAIETISVAELTDCLAAPASGWP